MWPRFWDKKSTRDGSEAEVFDGGLAERAEQSEDATRLVPEVAEILDRLAASALEQANSIAQCCSEVYGRLRVVDAHTTRQHHDGSQHRLPPRHTKRHRSKVLA